MWLLRCRADELKFCTRAGELQIQIRHVELATAELF